MNAFALEDQVYLHTKILNICPDEDCLAAVIAHEIVHIEEGHSKIDLDEQNAETVHTHLEKVSLGRIHEYEADSRATFKLNEAGYAPEGVERLMALLYQQENRADFTHGSAKDRQSAQLLLMKAVDFENSGNGHKKKSTEIDNLPEDKHLFQKLEGAFGTDMENYAKEVKGMSNELLLDYIIHLTGVFVNHPDWLKEKALKPQEYAKAGEILLYALNTILYRVHTTLPNSSDTEKMWCFMNLVSEVADQRLSQIQYASDLLKKIGYRDLSAELDVSSYLVDTFQSPDDMVEFIKYVQDQRDVEAFGFEKKERPYPYNLLWRYSQSPMGDPDEGDAFVGKAFEKFERQDQILQRLPEGMTNLSSGLDLLKSLGSVLHYEDVTPIKYWTRMQSDEFFKTARQRVDKFVQRKDPQLFDQNTDEFMRKYEDELKDKYLQIGLQEVDFYAHVFGEDQRASMIDKMVSDMAFRLYDDFDWGEGSQKQKDLKREILERLDPNLTKVREIWEKSDLDGLKKYVADNGLASAIEILNKLGLRRTNSPFSDEVNRYVQELIKSGTTFDKETDARVQQLIEKHLEYILLDEKEVLSLGDVSEENLEEIISGQKKLKLEKIQISPQFRRIMLQLDAYTNFGISQDENIAYKAFTDLLSSINVGELSKQEKLILLSMVHETMSAGGGHSSYGTQIPEFNWAVTFKQPLLTELSQAYFQEYIEGQDVDTQLKRLNTFTGSIAEVANRYLREPAGNFLGITEFHGEYTAPMLEYVMKNIANLDLSRQSREDLMQVHQLIGYFENNREKALIQNHIELQIIKISSFEEALAFIQEKVDENDGVSFAALDYFQENLILTPDQLTQARDVLEQAMKVAGDKGNEKVAAAAGVDYAFESYMTEHSTEFLDALIESGQDDTKLRTLLVKIWYEKYGHGTWQSPYQVVLPKIGSGEKIRLEGGAQHKFVPFESFINAFYEEVTQTEIDLLLRKLLISREGVLMTPEGQKMLHDILIQNIDAKDKPELEVLLSDLASSALKRIDAARLYQPIASLLRERILVKPPTAGNNDKAAEKVKDERNEEIDKYIDLYRSPSRRERTAFQREKDRKKAEEEVPRYEAMRIDNAIAMQLLSFNPYENGNTLTNPTIQRAVESINNASGHLKGIVDLPERDTSIQKISAVRTILEVAKSMGAVGVRFLQLLGQYVDIPPDMREEFDKVYDGMRGQLKFTAYQTLEREAKKSPENSEFHELWDNLAELSPIIGGGSLMTVYIATLKDGSRRVIKVLNPNTTSFVAANIQDSLNILQDLSSQTKYRNQPQFRLAGMLISDLEGWLNADVNATEYEKDNQHFDALHNGFGQGERKIEVPKMTTTGSKYIKVEEYVEGKNLTEMRTAMPSDEYQASVKLILENFVYQLTQAADQDGNRLVHSDVHAGNIRVDQEGNLNWLDRGYFLQFDQKEIQAILPLIESYRTGRADAGAIRGFVDHIFTIPENKQIGNMKKASILLNTTRFVAGQLMSGTPIDEIGQRFLLSLRENGVVIPIKWSLLMKNLLAIKKMSEV